MPTMSRSPFHSLLPSTFVAVLRDLTILKQMGFVLLLLTFIVRPAVAVTAKTTPTLALTFSPSTTVPAGQAVALTATITAGVHAGSPGVVSFFETGPNFIFPNPLGTAVLTGNNSATTHLTLGVGAHSIMAQLGTTSVYNSVASNFATLTVSPNATYKMSTSLSYTPASTPNNYLLSLSFTYFGGPNFASSSGIPASFRDLTLNAPVTSPVTSMTNSETFAPPVVLATGASKASLFPVTGDFNNDGRPDIAVTNLSDGSVSVFLGNGDGTFKTAVSYATGHEPLGLTTGDFNRDGVQDLAVANGADGTVSVLLGNGDGTFAAQKNFRSGSTTASEPYSVTVGDLNNDGIEDLVVTNYADRSVSVLLGNGDGTFGAQQSAAAGNDPVQTVVADFNGDGYGDLLTVNSFDGNLSELLGNGDGTFQSGPSIKSGQGKAYSNGTGTLPYNIAMTLWPSGYPALFVVANLGENAISDGNNVDLPIGGGPTSIAFLNDYGRLSIASANEIDNTIGVMYGDTAGQTEKFTLPALPQSTTPFYQVASADFNGDGRPDLVETTFGGNQIAVQLSTQTTVLTAPFTAPTPHQLELTTGTSSTYPYAAAPPVTITIP